MVTLDPIGALIGIAIIAAISTTMYKMVHTPSSRTEMIAAHATEQAQEITGVILVVFSSHIHSEVLMALAARMAKGRQAQLVAIYVIEVPYTLPIDAELPQETGQAGELRGALIAASATVSPPTARPASRPSPGAITSMLRTAARGRTAR